MSTTATANFNDVFKLRGSFSVFDTNVLTDPTTVTFKVRTPSGVTTSYTYAGTTVTKESTGVFYKNITLSEAGIWACALVGTGTVAKTEWVTIKVRGSEYGL